MTVRMPEPPVRDRYGTPYPQGWQPSLGRVRDAATEEDAIIEALVVAWTAPRVLGDPYVSALAATLLTRLGKPIPGAST